MNKYSMSKEGFLYRITALCDFGYVKKGTVGGLIETEHNLSHKGVSWVSGEAQVSGKAQVSGEAQVFGEAIATKPVICISNLPWHITISDNYVAVGCQNHPKEQWFKFTRREISAMATGAIQFYPTLKQLLKILA